MVFEIGYRSGLVNFELTSMSKLEVLRLHGCEGVFSGLEFLPSIKEVHLVEWKFSPPKVKEDIARQVANNQNRPILKVELGGY